ncbi:MAG: hypothetical protein HWN70_09205 [Desulfobacterales bacterium]|nr:hypothetical protein [Desulfobacterales bacterium]
MKARKKYFVISGIVLLVMLLTGIGLVAAWGPGRCFDSDFHSRFHGRNFHPGFHSKDFSEFILWRLDKKVKDLHLSDTQKEKYEVIKGKIETHLKEGFEDRKRLMEDFHTEINKEDPNIERLAETIKKKIKKVSGFMEESLELIVEFYETLDENQKDRVISHIREKAERCRI